MNRGDKEASCFKIVTRAMFKGVDGLPKINPFTGKSFLDVSDSEFEQDVNSYISFECNKNYFGLLEEDRLEIAQIIRCARPNPNLNDFPDFIFDDGFIEHFQITSSRSSKLKGSTQEQAAGKVRRAEKMQMEEWEQDEDFTGTRSKSWAVESTQHSYDFLVESFKRSWEDHIESLSKYQGCKNVGIFMIEYPDIALSMYEQKYLDWTNGMSAGDFMDYEKHRCYRLSRDKQLLNYIYAYRDQIKYVIYVYQDHFEVIKSESIPQLLKLLPWDFLIYPLVQQTISTLYNTQFCINTD